MEQVLVRFQDKTHSVCVPKSAEFRDNEQRILWLISLWSQRTGWPCGRLHVSSWQSPFVQISTVSSLLGGKGGFGTLLKGQSRQAGAKLTTDFGACRDLQGRRLRHVNDEIKLRKWREMETRKQEGEKVPDDELWKTPSGLYNWHLMTPTWADISKKATYRIKRQFQKLGQKAQKEAQLKKEQEEAYQKSMTMYLDQATSAVESIQQEIPDAIKQGLQAVSENKRKRAEVAPIVERSTNSLCTLSGDMVVVMNEQRSSAQMQSRSDFGTAVLVLDRSPPAETPILYYEVSLVTAGVAQIGWACLVGEQRFSPNNDLGDGVGDDAASYGVDGSRNLKFFAGKEESYALQWKQGDRLGCRFDTQKRIISFTVNGKTAGEAFSTTFNSLFPALSCNQGQVLELHTARDDCKYFPKKDAIAVQELIVSEDDASSAVSQQLVTESKAKAPVEFETEERRNLKLKPSSSQKESISKKPPVKIVQAEPLDLGPFESANELESLGLGRLKAALMALHVKCGGTLVERAARLFSLKGLEPKDFPQKVRAKGFVE